MYYIVENEFGVTRDQLRGRFPNVSFPAEGHDFGLPGVEPYSPAQMPTFDPLTQDCVEITPVGGVQQWQVTDLPAHEAERRRRALIPTVVTMRQARLALLQVGKLDDIEAVVASLGRAAQLEWEYAAIVERSNPLIDSIGMTDTELDELFILAATI